MIVVNLYADHLLPLERENRVRTAEEIWYATTQRPAYFARAARVLGLSPAEYREFVLALLDGKSIHVKMPRRLDAMVGDRHGRLYAVRDATVRHTRAPWPNGYRVTLADGTAVFVTDPSGSFSVLRPHASQHAGRHPRATTVVYVQPPDAVPPRAAVAVAVPPPSKHCGWWCFGLPLDATFPGLLGAHNP